MKLWMPLLLALALFAAPNEPAHKGAYERIKVHGRSLEGNLAGDSPDRDVSVYLPPSYGTDRARRYPVVYLLHGYTNSDEGWYGPNTKSGFQTAGTTLPAVADQALASGAAREMILVMPNAYNIYQGSMYSNSVTTGDWESYISHDLVEYIDSHYRTIADRAARSCRPLHGRLRHDPARNERSRRVFEHLHFERLLPHC